MFYFGESGQEGFFAQKQTHTDVLVWFPLFDHLCEAALHNTGGPFVHLTLVVVVTTYNAFDTLREKQAETQTALSDNRSVYSHVEVTGCCFTGGDADEEKSLFCIKYPR